MQPIPSDLIHTDTLRQLESARRRIETLEDTAAYHARLARDVARLVYRAPGRNPWLTAYLGALVLSQESRQRHRRVRWQRVGTTVRRRHRRVKYGKPLRVR